MSPGRIGSELVVKICAHEKTVEELPVSSPSSLIVGSFGVG